MTVVAAFDSHAYVKKLVSTGVPEPQAEVHAEVLTMLIREELVTKQYLDLRLKELEAGLTERIIKWVAGMLVAQAAVVATLVKLL